MYRNEYESVCVMSAVYAVSSQGDVVRNEIFRHSFGTRRARNRGVQYCSANCYTVSAFLRGERVTEEVIGLGSQSCLNAKLTHWGAVKTFIFNFSTNQNEWLLLSLFFQSGPSGIGTEKMYFP